VQAVLLAHRQKHFGPASRWFISGKPDQIAEALEDGQPVIVSSRLLWSALFTAGLPNDDYGRDARHDGKYWRVDEHDVFSEWTDPHPGEVEVDAAYNGQHCAGDRTCFRCDPGNTGRQNIDVPRTRQVYDWCFIE
jgi:hypothetical protein